MDKLDKLYIVGGGVGDTAMLTEKAKAAIAGADRILSTGRIGKAFSDKNVTNCTLSQLTSLLTEKGQGVTAVLVSGDCGFFSVSKSIIRDFSGAYHIEIVNGISSIQYFSGKIAVSYDDALICSMHGRDEGIVPKVSYNKKVFALTGGDNKAHRVCEILTESGLGHVNVWVGERLSYEDERIIKGAAFNLKDESFDDLSVMYIENLSFKSCHTPLKDDDFIRGGAPMTKEEVRWLSISKLGVLPLDTVYDIGAGTGSVAVEMARKAFDGFVYAIEMKEDACLLIEENKKKHGAYNLKVINKEAPCGLTPLPPADKAFIGGSTGRILEILTVLTEKNPDVKVVSNAVTLQGLNQIMSAYEKIGFSNSEIICVNVSKAKKAGVYDMMQAQNPVYIITGSKREL